MKEPARWEVPATAARLILGAVFLVSGGHKVTAPAAEFAAVIEGYRLLPPDMIMPLATALPWLETFLGVALLTGYLTRQAAACAGGFLLLFIGGLASTKLRGIELANCGCFGGGIHLTVWQALSLDTTLTLLAYFLFRNSRSFLSLDGWVEKGS